MAVSVTAASAVAAAALAAGGRGRAAARAAAAAAARVERRVTLPSPTAGGGEAAHVSGREVAVAADRRAMGRATPRRGNVGRKAVGVGAMVETGMGQGKRSRNERPRKRAVDTAGDGDTVPNGKPPQRRAAPATDLAEVNDGSVGDSRVRKILATEGCALTIPLVAQQRRRVECGVRVLEKDALSNGIGAVAQSASAAGGPTWGWRPLHGWRAATLNLVPHDADTFQPIVSRRQL